MAKTLKELQKADQLEHLDCSKVTSVFLKVYESCKNVSIVPKLLARKQKNADKDTVEEMKAYQFAKNTNNLDLIKIDSRKPK